MDTRLICWSNEGLEEIAVIEVSRWLVYSRASITLDVYGHLIPGMRCKVAELINELVMPVVIQIEQKES
jgi:hypothetical protein